METNPWHETLALLVNGLQHMPKLAEGEEASICLKTTMEMSNGSRVEIRTEALKSKYFEGERRFGGGSA